ncbi:MAG: T9SS type A sorting domain-containing protein [Bacteroidetes bacterium]|nr:T9SS type A sorting domain-containing protein [Bacteroidota bacterium]
MKTIKYHISIITILLTFNLTHAQNWLWAKDGGSVTNSNASGVIFNTNGNIYFRGGYAGTLALDSISLISYPNGNTFVISSTTNGVFLKGTNIAAQNGQSGFSMQSLTNDKTDNVYLTGSINGTNIFDTINTVSYYDGYSTKFNSNLNALSVKYASSVVYSAAFDNEKNAYLVGTIDLAVKHIDTFTLYNSHVNPIFNHKTFLTKLDSTGKCLWVKQSWDGIGGIASVKLYRNSLYMYGVVDSCFLFDTATICNTRPNGSGFLTKTDTGGNVLWVRNYIPAKSAFFTGISLDNTGNCYLSGWLDSTVTIGGYTLQKTAGSNRNTFLVKYDSTGLVAWAKRISCTGDMLALGINTDEDGKTYITGNFSGTAIFGSDTVTASNSDMYVTRFDNAGNCLGYKTVVGATSKSIAQDDEGNAIVTGNISNGTTYFDSIPTTATGISNFFLAKLQVIDGVTYSVRMLPDDNRLKIYANPNTGTFTIEVPQGIVSSNRAQLGIYNSAGGVVKEEAVDISNNKLSIDIGTVQKGMYTVTLSSGGKKYSGRVVIN